MLIEFAYAMGSAFPSVKKQEEVDINNCKFNFKSGRLSLKRKKVTILNCSIMFILLTCIVSTLQISLVEAAIGTCGNGVLEKFEQCDDGNVTNWDGCSSLCQIEGDKFRIVTYTSNDPPPIPILEELPLLSQIGQHGITWTFSTPQRVGRFVNGDYYVVGTATIIDIQPFPTSTNGRHGLLHPTSRRAGLIVVLRQDGMIRACVFILRSH